MRDSRSGAFNISGEAGSFRTAQFGYLKRISADSESASRLFDFQEMRSGTIMSLHTYHFGSWVIKSCKEKVKKKWKKKRNS